MTYQEWKAEEDRLIREQAAGETEYIRVQALFSERWKQLLSHKPDLTLSE